jgi:hypothetical protein
VAGSGLPETEESDHHDATTGGAKVRKNGRGRPALAGRQKEEARGNGSGQCRTHFPKAVQRKSGLRARSRELEFGRTAVTAGNRTGHLRGSSDVPDQAPDRAKKGESPTEARSEPTEAARSRPEPRWGPAGAAMPKRATRPGREEAARLRNISIRPRDGRFASRGMRNTAGKWGPVATPAPITFLWTRPSLVELAPLRMPASGARQLLSRAFAPAGSPLTSSRARPGIHEPKRVRISARGETSSLSLDHRVHGSRIKSGMTAAAPPRHNPRDPPDARHVAARRMLCYQASAAVSVD